MSEATPHLSHPKYRADIDGLRAIAVLAVVIFHAFPSALRGGFIGVDSYTYTATSGGVTETATVTVTVKPAAPPVTPEPPVVEPPVVPGVFNDFGDQHRIVRMQIPLHPIIYVTREVADRQAEQAMLQTLGTDTGLHEPGQQRATSIGLGLGQDPTLYVQHAVRDAQRGVLSPHHAAADDQ